jgi:DDE_Tnp_1-associated
VAVLALAAAVVLTGARSLAAIAEWAADAPPGIRAALGARREAPDRFSVPSEATIRRTLARLDGDALTACVGAWLADREGPDQRRRAVAVDGKTLRGAKRDGRRVHLLSAMEHATWAVLAQREVDGAGGEVAGFAPLLADVALAGAVVTADALHTHAEAAAFPVTGKQADDLFVVKAKGAHAPGPLRDAGLAQRARAGPHPRPGPRPSGDSYPQGGLGARLRLPARLPGPPVTREVRDLDTAGGGPRSSTRSPAWPMPTPAPPAWPTSSAATGPSKTACTTSAT